MLLAAAGWFSGFDGSFEFENIGDSYTEHHVPYVGIRALPAVLGSLTVPIVFQIMKESGYPTIVAAFSACLVLLGACDVSYMLNCLLIAFRIQTTATSHSPA